MILAGAQIKVCVRFSLLLTFMLEGHTVGSQRYTGAEDLVDLTSKLYDLQLSASSYAVGYPPKFGRITESNRPFQSHNGVHECTSIMDEGQFGIVQVVKGWCARQDDNNPYLQIDFLIPVEMKTIKVFSWLEVSFIDAIIVTKRAGNITILHGNSTAVAFKELGEVNGSQYFGLSPGDKKLGIPEGSRVRTLSVNITARYLRIQPDPSESSGSCLILQVLGRGDLVYVDIEPEVNITSLGLFEVDTVTFLENPANHLGEYNNSDCKPMCLVDESCQVAVYDHTDGTCNVYKYVPSDIPALTHRRDYTKQFQKIYIRDNLREKVITSNFLLITFPRFPLFYSSPETIHWFIDFSSSGRSPILVFEDFGSTKNEKYIYKNISWLRPNIGQQAMIASTGHALLIRIVPFPNRNETRRAIAIKDNYTSVEIESNLRQSYRADFRAVISASDYATIYFRDEDLKLSRTQSQGVIYSESFLGFLGLRTSYYDLYFGPNYNRIPMYLGIYIELFNFRCDSRLAFAISNTEIGKNSTSHCNTNRPFRSLQFPATMQKMIYVSITDRVKDVEQGDGFKAYFEIKAIPTELKTEISYGRNQKSMPYLRDENTPFDTLAAGVCTETNCYTPHGGIPDSPTRRDAEIMCSREANGSLASIHSLDELRFVRFYMEHLMHKTKLYSDPDPYLGFHRRFVDHVHLGSIEYKYQNGKKMSFWSDGSPVVFTSWSKSIHSLPKQNSCVVMKIWQTVDDDVLSRGDCNETAHYFVCKNSTNVQANRMEMPVVSTNSVNNSTYFHCGSGEIISVYGVCDGYSDCTDGNDEKNCDYNDQCNDEKFSCGDGTCVPYSMYCDLVKDCNNGMDEHKCDSIHKPTPWRFNPYLDSIHKPTPWRFNPYLDRCPPSFFPCQIDKEGGCIPKEYVCNGVQDCENSVDENEEICNPKARTSCLEWWNNGQRTTGLYSLFDGSKTVTAECNFDAINTTGLIQTLFHNADSPYSSQKTRGYLLIFEGYELVDRMIRESKLKCEQTFTQTCPINRLTVAELLDLRYHPEYWDCLCVKHTIFTYKKEVFLEACSNATQNLVEDSVIQLSNFTIIDVHKTLRYGWRKYKLHKILALRDETLTRRKPSLFIGPVKCDTDTIDLNNPRTLVCTRGHPVSPAVKCLYDYDEKGRIIGCADLTHLQQCSNFMCPEGFVKCPKSFCIALRYFCDGQNDCPAGEDEKYCNVSGVFNPMCKGLFRCMGTKVCLPQSQVCDGTKHCRNGDDERLCYFTCPLGCFCRGYEVECPRMDNESAAALKERISRNTRKLHLSEGQFTHAPVLALLYVGVFNLSHGQLVELGSRSFTAMKGLLTLDLRFNDIRKLHNGAFIGLDSLKHLLLDGNENLFSMAPGAFQGLTRMEYLKISNTRIKHLYMNTFIGLVNLLQLDLTSNGIIAVDGFSFDGLSNLKALNIQFNKIETFNGHMFKGLPDLQRLDSDEYAFCCLKPPNVTSANCTPSADEFSSCKDLMQSQGPRFLLWVVGFLSLIGNTLSLLYRLIFDRQRLKIGYGTFVTNLTVADFCMGLYLLIIAGADIYYRDVYIWSDWKWRHSGFCKFAGFLSTLSSEASVFFICLITLDRLLVIKFPFGTWKFTPRCAIVFSIFCWLLAAAISVIPFLFKTYFKEEFYSKNAVCLALPLTKTKTTGWEYSVSVFIFINFLTFLFIALGQCLIYKETESTRENTGTKQRQGDLVVARNLLLVVATDFLCWCPIGIMGIMSLCDVVVPGEVYVWTTVLILPINSALNPFLYTLSAIWRKEKFVPDVHEQSENSTIDITALRSSLKADHVFGLSVESLQLLFGTKSVSLGELMRTGPGFDSDEARKIPEMLSGQVSYLHDMKMCFSDLQPDDIRIALDGKTILLAGICIAPNLMKTETDKTSDIIKVGKLTNRLISICNRMQVKEAGAVG